MCVWVGQCVCLIVPVTASHLRCQPDSVLKDWRYREHAWWKLVPNTMVLLPLAAVAVFGFSLILTDGFSLFLYPRKLCEWRHYRCRPWTEAGKSEAGRPSPGSVPSPSPPSPGTTRVLPIAARFVNCVGAFFLSLANCRKISEQNADYFLLTCCWEQC